MRDDGGHALLPGFRLARHSVCAHEEMHRVRIPPKAYLISEPQWSVRLPSASWVQKAVVSLYVAEVRRN
jgi:hypothetical protein